MYDYKNNCTVSQSETAKFRDINPYSAGIDFSRQNLMSEDVRFWQLKSIPAL